MDFWTWFFSTSALGLINCAGVLAFLVCLGIGCYIIVSAIKSKMASSGLPLGIMVWLIGSINLIMIAYRYNETVK